MISTKKKFLFIHIPKTGGNSLQNILRKYSDDEIVCTANHHDGIERFEIRNVKYNITKHSTLYAWQKELEPETFNKLFKLAIIRNPWDRMISLYFSPHQGNVEWNRNRFIKKVKSALTFRDYIVASSSLLYLIRRVCRSMNIEQFSRKLHIKKLDSDIDYILRYESLDEDFEKLCNIIDIPHEQLPVRNVSERKHYSYYYDEELKEIVRNKFLEEIRYMNYKFKSM